MTSDNTALTLLYITYSSPEDAQAAAQDALNEKLIACANISAPHQACYIYEGRPVNAEETAVIFKTSADRAEAARAFLIARHPYDCPCILTLHADATPDFAAWVNTQTSA